MRGAMAGPDRAQPKVPPCHRVAVSSCHPAGPQVLSGPAVPYTWPVSLEQRPNDEPHEHGRDTESTDRRGRLRARASAVSAVVSACHDGATGRNFSGGGGTERPAHRDPPPHPQSTLPSCPRALAEHSRREERSAAVGGPPRLVRVHAVCRSVAPRGRQGSSAGQEVPTGLRPAG